MTLFPYKAVGFKVGTGDSTVLSKLWITRNPKNEYEKPPSKSTQTLPQQMPIF